MVSKTTSLLIWESYETHKYTLRAKYKVFKGSGAYSNQCNWKRRSHINLVMLYIVLPKQVLWIYRVWPLDTTDLSPIC